ncbi:MAG: hypothetical protein IJ635_00625 [Bacteroidaceae bacterium]|nr:hypothetical protein [Bacteroidaceae bacterium]
MKNLPIIFYVIILVIGMIVYFVCPCTRNVLSFLGGCASIGGLYLALWQFQIANDVAKQSQETMQEGLEQMKKQIASLEHKADM